MVQYDRDVLCRIEAESAGEEMIIKPEDYTVGALAKFYGISADSIRLYDKKGILPSKKNDENNYRIYSRADLIVMDFIVKLRSMDISLADVSEILNNFGLGQTLDTCRTKLASVEAEIQRLQQISRKLGEFITRADQIEGRLNMFSIKENPAFIIRDIDASIADTNKAFESLPLDTMPLLTIYTRDGYSEEHMEKMRQKRSRAAVAEIYISQEDHLGISEREDFNEKGFFVMKPKMCIHVVMCMMVNEEYRFSEEIKKYAKQHSFSLTGESIARLILTEKNQSEPRDYYEIWSAIE